jgi:hypothetical protein
MISQSSFTGSPLGEAHLLMDRDGGEEIQSNLGRSIQALYCPDSSGDSRKFSHTFISFIITGFIFQR